MEGIQREGDGGLTREKKLKKLEEFCKGHTHGKSCPLYAYCEEVKAPFFMLTDSAIDRLYEEYILKPAFAEVFTPTSTKPITTDDIHKITEDFKLIGKLIGVDMAEPSQEAKADAGKAQISLVPMEIVWAIAWIRMYGNRKYGDPENWKTVKPQRYRDALMRHILNYISDPDSVDEESGYPHLWHAACNMAFLMHMDYGPMAYFDWNEELWEKVKKGEIG